MKNKRMTVLFFVLVSLLFSGSHGVGANKLVIGLPGDTSLHPVEIIDRFIEENPDIEVETLRMGWTDFFEKLPVMIISGTAPDVWYGEAGRAIGWRHNGFTADLSAYVERDLNMNDYFFLDASVDPRTGEWTGLPADFQVTAMFYNTNHLSQQGLDFPNPDWTTNDLIDAAQKLTIPGPGCPMQYGINLRPSSITAGWMLWPRLLGGRILNEDRTESRLDDPATIEAFELLGRMMHEMEITPVPTGCTGYSLNNGKASFQFDIYSLNRNLHSVDMTSYDVEVIPRSPEGNQLTTVVPNVWVMNDAISEESKEAAWRWIKFQLGEYAQELRMLAGAGVLVNRNVSHAFLDEPGPPTNRIAFLNSFNFAVTLEENIIWDETRVAIGAALQPIWRATAPARTVLENAHDQLSTMLEEAYRDVLR